MIHQAVDFAVLEVKCTLEVSQEHRWRDDVHTREVREGERVDEPLSLNAQQQTASVRTPAGRLTHKHRLNERKAHELL